MTLLPYSEQMLAQSRLYESELHIRSITPVAGTPEALEAEVTNILEYFSTGTFGGAEAVGALATVAGVAAAERNAGGKKCRPVGERSIVGKGDP